MTRALSDVELVFTKPVIAGKVYITKGPSGWTETFKRSDADGELARFVKPASIDAVLDVFVSGRKISKAPTDWFTITGFLGRTMSCSPRAVPHTVAIAFWGRVVMQALEAGGN